MKRAFNLFTMAILCMAGTHNSSARAPEPSFPNTIQVESGAPTLIKLGEYRYVYRIFFKLYDAALYAPADTEPEDVLTARTSYRLQFRYLRELNKSIILESSAKMLKRNLSAQELAQIAKRVARLNAAYTTVKGGDQSSLTYQPEVGTTLRINGKPVVTIEGDDFARLYFQIWLGERPISESLRESLLGRR
jgi:hypothetical protein